MHNARRDITHIHERIKPYNVLGQALRGKNILYNIPWGSLKNYFYTLRALNGFETATRMKKILREHIKGQMKNEQRIILCNQLNVTDSTQTTLVELRCRKHSN